MRLRDKLGWVCSRRGQTARWASTESNRSSFRVVGRSATRARWGYFRGTARGRCGPRGQSGFDSRARPPLHRRGSSSRLTIRTLHSTTGESAGSHVDLVESDVLNHSNFRSSSTCSPPGLSTTCRVQRRHGRRESPTGADISLHATENHTLRRARLAGWTTGLRRAAARDRSAYRRATTADPESRVTVVAQNVLLEHRDRCDCGASSRP